MRAAVSRDNSKETAIHIVVEEHDLTSILDDLSRRSNARDARWLALKDGIGLYLSIAEIFHFAEKLGLVLREIWCRRWSPAAPSLRTGWRIAATARCGSRRRSAAYDAN